MTFGVVVVAAGRSTRLGRDKLFLSLGGVPVLARSLQAFEDCPEIGVIALVMNADNLPEGRRLVEQRGLGKVRHFCLGGVRRQDSVMAGLSALRGCDWVAVHDGARPLVTPALIAAGLTAARETGAAVPGIAVKDTIKVVDAEDTIVATPERSALRAVQTPQVFRYGLLVDAYARASGDVTDDASLLESLGHPVKVFPGDYANLKITIAEDIGIAEVLLRRREGP